MNAIIEKIYQIQKKHNLIKDVLAQYIRRHYPEVFAELHDKTSFLDKFRFVKNGKLRDVSIQERMYCLEHNLTDRPKCAVCGKEYVSRFIIHEDRYTPWCSISCSCKDKATIQKSKQTRKDRYGCETYHGTEKARKTRAEKYDGHFHPADFGQKTKATKKANHGSENYVNSKKARQTKLERYGSASYHNAEKARQTKLERYNDPDWSNREKFRETVRSFSDEKRQKIQEKRKATNREKYSAEFAAQSKEVREKTAQTNIARYGAPSVLSTKEVRKKLTKAKREKSWLGFQNDPLCIPLFSHDEYVEAYSPDIPLKWRCRKCGHEFLARYDNGQHLPCDKCFPRTIQGTSKAEQEVVEFVKTLADDVLWKSPLNRSLLGNREVDILIPSKKVGIEFDGLYYHSGKGPKYNLDKTVRCQQNGYQLINIFEDEWMCKQKIVKSRLRHLLTSSQRKIGARKCTVAEVSNAVKDRFLEKYHIQGKDVSGIRLGLFYRGHLVAVMTFVRSRFSKRHQYELSRYATVANFTIVGGASKLLARFEKTYSPKSLVTYADRRWSIGSLYFKLGFSFARNSQPAYWYVKNGVRYSRIVFQKHRLKNINGFMFDQGKSEIKNMLDNGYSMIYDCGNLVFEKIYV